MYASPRFLSHAVKVVSAVNLAVTSLKDLPTLVPILRNLGQKHVAYGVVTEHYDLVGGALIATLVDALEEKWTDDVKEAWLAIWGLLRSTMDPDAN